MLVCFHCGAANSPDKTHCHSCHAPLPTSGTEQQSAADTESSSPAEPVEAGVVCFHCGTQNTPQAMECTHCGAALPRMDQSTQSRTFDVITDRYDEFKNAAERVKKGEWSAGELKDWLSRMNTKLNSRADYLIDVIRQSGYYDYRSEEVDLGMTGVLDYQEGMEVMGRFLEDGNPLHIDEALEKIWEGNEKINEAMRMNREFRRQLEEDWGYM